MNKLYVGILLLISGQTWSLGPSDTAGNTSQKSKPQQAHMAGAIEDFFNESFAQIQDTNQYARKIAINDRYKATLQQVLGQPNLHYLAMYLTKNIASE